MKQSILEVVTHAENAMAYSNQALAILEMWLDSLDNHDEAESNRVAAIQSLVYEALSHLKKTVEVKK